MLQMIISSLTLIFSFSFLQMNHPLSMGLMLLLQTLFICLMTGLLSKTFWFSYILFLVFLGGMLVLFIYVTSLASNEMFIFSVNNLLLSTFMLLTSLIILLLIDKSLLMSMINNNEMFNMNNLDNYSKENSLSLNKLYNFPTNLITIMLILYLFITLVAVVKITNVFYGPLRPMT
nr:NADH dehydrogenase subunit 6 [Tachydromia umbrarum]